MGPGTLPTIWEFIPRGHALMAILMPLSVSSSIGPSQAKPEDGGMDYQRTASRVSRIEERSWLRNSWGVGDTSRILLTSLELSKGMDKPYRPGRRDLPRPRWRWGICLMMPYCWPPALGFTRIRPSRFRSIRNYLGRTQIS